MPRSHRRRANSRGQMLGFRALPLTPSELFSGRPLRHTGFGSRWGLLSASINRWVLVKRVHSQDDLLPRRSTTRVRGDRPRECRPGELLGQAPVDQRAVGGISSCVDRVPAGVSSATTPMCGDRRTAAETRGPSRLPLCDAGVRRVGPTATPSRNDDIQTPITEESATLQLDEGLRSPSSATSPGEESPPPALRQPD